MLKKYFTTGLMIWVPVVVTLLFIQLIVGMGDKFLAVIPDFFDPTTWLGFGIPGYGLLFLVLVIWLTGILAKNVLGQRLVALWESVLSKVPLVRSIYYGVKRCLQVLFTTNKAFQQVVLVEYPRTNCWSLAFVTDSSPAQQIFDKSMLVLFLPTTPNPTSGYILVVPKKDVLFLDMSIDDAIQFVISLGTACSLNEVAIQDKLKKKG